MIYLMQRVLRMMLVEVWPFDGGVVAASCRRSERKGHRNGCHGRQHGGLAVAVVRRVWSGEGVVGFPCFC